MEEEDALDADLLQNQPRRLSYVDHNPHILSDCLLPRLSPPSRRQHNHCDELRHQPLDVPLNVLISLPALDANNGPQRAQQVVSVQRRMLVRLVAVRKARREDLLQSVCDTARQDRKERGGQAELCEALERETVRLAFRAVWCRRDGDGEGGEEEGESRVFDDARVEGREGDEGGEGEEVGVFVCARRVRRRRGGEDVVNSGDAELDFCDREEGRQSDEVDETLEGGVASGEGTGRRSEDTEEVVAVRLEGGGSVGVGESGGRREYGRGRGGSDGGRRRSRVRGRRGRCERGEEGRDVSKDGRSDGHVVRVFVD